MSAHRPWGPPRRRSSVTLVLLAATSCKPDTPAPPPPVVSLLMPSDGADITGKTTVVATGTGDAELTLSLDAMPVTAAVREVRHRWDSTDYPDGGHVWSVTDGVRVDSVRVVVNNEGQAGALSFLTPTHGELRCGAHSVELDAPLGTSLAEIRLDEELLAEVSAWPWRVAWDPRAAEPGTHILTATAITPDGARIADGIVVRTDGSTCVESPTIQVEAPLAGAWVNGEIAASAVNNGGTWVGVSLDGERVADGGAVTLDTTTLAEGEHVLLWAARSEDDEEARTTSRFYVDRTAPTLVAAPVSSPASGVVTLTATAEDAGALARVTLAIDGAELCSFDEEDSFVCTWDSTTASSGAHTLTWTAADAAGNLAQTALLVDVDHPPTLVLTVPASPLAGTIPVSVTPNDDLAVGEVSLTLNGAPLTTLTAEPWTFSWDTCEAGPGPHTLNATARDARGQTGEARADVVVDQPLAIEIDAPTGDLAAVTELVARTTGDAPLVGVTWTLDGVPVASSSTSAAGGACTTGCLDTCLTWSAAPDWTGLVAGSYTLMATATDELGETATVSASVTLVGDLDGDGAVSDRFGGDDCDDADPNVFVGAPETCDDLDQSCDGVVDEGFDQDGDGARSLDCPGGDDCDDTDAAVFPGATDVCDSLDNDCDGLIDLIGAPSAHIATFGTETDSAYLNYMIQGNVVTFAQSARLTGLSFYVHPYGVSDASFRVFEAEDMDGPYVLIAEADTVIEGDPAWHGADTLDVTVSPDRWYLLAMTADIVWDAADHAPTVWADDLVTVHGTIDDPGMDPGIELIEDEELNPDRMFLQMLTLEVLDPLDTDADLDGVSLWCGDCDDEDPGLSPALSETCDGLDNDCDGVAAPGEEDADSDGVRACADDCDEADPTVFPGANEACNGRDDDCDGVVLDEDDADGDGMRACDGDCDDTDPTVVADGAGFADDDGDGYGDPDRPAASCPAPPGYVADNTDCDDHNASVNPAATEVCDAEDNNCDGVVNEGAADDDGDGATTCDDCDDADPAVFPGATEDCADNLDSDCDGFAPGCPIDVSADALGLMVGDNGDQAGFALASGGDLDGDGLDDVLVGAPYNNEEGSDAGGAYVVNGAWRSSTDLGMLRQRIMGQGSRDLTGYSVAVLPDADGDGLPDVVIGAPVATGSATDSGVVFLLFSPISGIAILDGDYDAWFRGVAEDDLAGAAVADAGDLDADGLSDLVIGAPGVDDTEDDQGAAWLVLGPGLGSQDLATGGVRFVGVGLEHAAGSTVAGVGDTDGDGADEVAVGAVGSTYGSLYVVDGSTAAGSLADAPVVIAGRYSGDELGAAVVGGDLDGDGYGDLVVGIPGRYPGGGACVVAGPLRSGVVGGEPCLWTTATDARAGASLALGDIDLDGGPDLLIGAPDADGGAGLVWWVEGPLAGSLVLETVGTELGGATAGAALGAAVTIAGDLDEDGYPEIVLGGTGYASSAGAVWLVAGGGW